MSSNPTSKFVQFPFGAGMNEYSDPRLLEAPAVIDAVNVRIPKQGSYAKRYGTSLAFSSMTVPSWTSYGFVASAQAQLSSVGDAIVYADPQSIAVGSTARAALLWRGHAPLGEPRKRTLWANTINVSSTSSNALTSFANVDCAAGTLANGKTVIAVAWTTDASFATLAVFDGETYAPINTTYAGSTLDPVFMTGTLSWPRLMWLGSDLYCLAHSKGTNKLTLWKLTTSTWTWASVADVVTDARNSSPRAWFDVCVLTSTTFALAYQTTGNALKVLRVTASTGAIANTVTSAEAAAAIDAIGVHGTTGESIWVTYVVNASGQARVTNIVESTWLERASFPMSVSCGANQAFCSGSARVSSTKQALFFSRYDGASLCQVYATSVTTAAAADANNCVNHNAMMIGKPVASGTGPRIFVPVIWGGAGNNVGVPWGTSAVQFSSGVFQYLHDRPTFTTWANMPSVTQITRVATPPGLELVGSNPNIFAPCSFALLGTKLYHVWPEVRGIVGKSAVRESIELHSYDTSSVDYLKAARLGPAGYMAGLTVDATATYDHTPIARPERLTAADSAGAGTQVAGTYQYRVVYAASTASGQVSRSAPSDAKQYVAPGLKDCVLTIPNVPGSRTWLPDPNGTAYTTLYAEVYRTIAGSSGPYYYVGRTSNLTPSGSTTTYQDNAADATIATYPQLYTGDVSTQRSACANVLPPSFVHEIVHRDRLFGLAPDRRTIWFSDKIVLGEVPQFHDEMTLSVDDTLVGLFSLDYSIGACSSTAFYTMQGDGPSNRFPAADSDYQGFQRVAADVGATSPKSFCLTPDGIVYRSSNGLNVLTRSGQVVPFGLEVTDRLAANTLNTSIIIHPSQRWLYVTCDDGTSIGTRLVYDYRHKVWSRDTVVTSQQDKATSQVAHAGAVYFTSGANAFVWKEDAATCLDYGSWATMTVTFAWFKGAGIQGFQGSTRFAFIANRSTPHGMSATVDYDYSTVRTESFSWTDAQVSAFENAPIVQWQRLLTIRENQAFRVTLSDAAPTTGATGIGQGATWVAWGVDHEVKKEPAPLPAAQQK